MSKANNLLLLIFVIISLQVFSQTLQDSLLIHYNFDGDSLDYSGNEYNPILFRATYADDCLTSNPLGQI